MEVMSVSCSSAAQGKTSALLPEGLTDTIYRCTAVRHNLERLLEKDFVYPCRPKFNVLWDEGALRQRSARAWCFGAGQIRASLGHGQ